VSKQIVTSQSFIGKKLNKSTSFDIDKAADTIAEELISKKIQKNVHEQQYEGLSLWRNEWKTFFSD
jgi:TRAP-type C4-dicarboxylate transport system substrate-binding protein